MVVLGLLRLVELASLAVDVHPLLSHVAVGRVALVQRIFIADSLGQVDLVHRLSALKFVAGTQVLNYARSGEEVFLFILSLDLNAYVLAIEVDDLKGVLGIGGL